jgi:S1-C subfamily serine protease
VGALENFTAVGQNNHELNRSGDGLVLRPCDVLQGKQPVESFIVCGNCKSRLKVPPTIAAGKKVKCPKCSELVTVTAQAVSESAPAAGKKSAPAVKPAAAQTDAGGYVFQESAAEPTPLAPAMKSCPFCGEQVLLSAVKCRHCGEFFEAEAAATSSVKRGRDSSAVDGLNPAEYVVAIVAGPVGLVIGLVWKIKGLRKALEMLKISALSCVIVAALALTLKFYVFTDPIGPAAPTGWVQYGGPTYSYEEQYGERYGERTPDPSQASSPADMPADLSVLNQQPPEIRRAMRANVRISQQAAMGSGVGVGSGVIVRHENGKATILTNRHVVDSVFAQSHGRLQLNLSGIPEPEITFVTSDKNKGKVIWIAADEVDLAVVEAPCPDGVEAVAWQVTDDIQIGEQVFAVGNPMGLGWTFTRGVVSALRQHEYGTRKVPVVQTDTRIGPGNSGGGLYNQKGELIGINTFVLSPSQSSAGETGLGFAIRKSVLTELKPEMLQLQSGSEPATP